MRRRNVNENSYPDSGNPPGYRYYLAPCRQWSDLGRILYGTGDSGSPPLPTPFFTPVEASAQYADPLIYTVINNEGIPTSSLVTLVRAAPGRYFFVTQEKPPAGCAFFAGSCSRDLGDHRPHSGRFPRRTMDVFRSVSPSVVGPIPAHPEAQMLQSSDRRIVRSP